MRTATRSWNGLLVIAVLVAAGVVLRGDVRTQAQGVPTVASTNNDTLGPILVDQNGLTLYMRTSDMPGTSSCTGGCATAWPALQPPADGSLTLADGLTGTLDVFTRSDGGQQVEYDGMPLYYFASDKAPGDIKGQGIGNVWFAAVPEAPAATGSQVQPPITVQANNNATLGQIILVDLNGMTLYIRTSDMSGASTCTGGCATTWPPLRPPASGSPVLAAGVTGTLDAFTRDDGSQQVEYNGMPLYNFANDKSPGDAKGQGIGGVWFAAQPASQ